MKERPILFSAPMVRALLDGSKTQTRRIVKWQGPKGFSHFFDRAYVDNPAGVQRLCVPYHHPDDADDVAGNPAHRHYCPYGDPGDRLWVRETWYCDDYRVQRGPYLEVDGATDKDMMFFRADGEPDFEGERFAWKPAIHMPHWASRILLEIVSVRVERLHSMTDADAIAEGIAQIGMHNDTPLYWFEKTDELNCGMTSPLSAFANLWGGINGAKSWNANPFVWVVEFKRVPDTTSKESK